MEVLLYLLVPIVVVTVGSAFLAMRQRKPSSPTSSIDAFQREMRALAPDDEQRRS